MGRFNIPVKFEESRKERKNERERYLGGCKYSRRQTGITVSLTRSSSRETKITFNICFRWVGETGLLAMVQTCCWGLQAIQPIQRREIGNRE